MVDVTRDQYPARICQALKTRGDVYTVPFQVVVFHHDIAGVNSYPEVYPAVFGEAFILPFYFPLDRQRSSDCLDGTRELGHQSVTCCIENPAAVR